MRALEPLNGISFEGHAVDILVIAGEISGLGGDLSAAGQIQKKQITAVA